SVLTHMSDGVIATNRRGKVNIINQAACDYLDVNEEDTLGKSILDVLDIREDYTLHDLLENQEEITLDMSADDHDQILHAYFSLIQRESGFISGIVGGLRDVTEQEKIDRESRQFA